MIDPSNIENAYNDGTKIVIYQGLLDKMNNDDEIALILGHEVAHGMLGHLTNWNDNTSVNDVAVLEASADKYGAFLMMKSGYDVCKGRQIFKYWKQNHGNALGQNHPDYSYRYDELNVNCGD